MEELKEKQNLIIMKESEQPERIEEIEQRALIKVSPLKDITISSQVENAQKALEYARGRVIKSVDDVKSATSDLALISKLQKTCKGYLDDYTKPIKAHMDEIRAEFDSILNPLKEADAITRGKIIQYNQGQNEIRRKQEEAERLSREAAEAEMKLNGELSQEIIVIENKAEVTKKTQSDFGDLNTAKVWKFEVEDFAKLPDDYKVADLVKIRKVVIAGVNIPGVKAWQEDSLRITTRGV